MSPRPIRRRSRRRESFPWGWLVLGSAVLVAVLGGFAWLYVTASARNIELAGNLCPQTGPIAQHLALIDVSDPISAITRQDLLNRLYDAAAKTEKGALFELRVLNPGTTNSSVLFSLCNPGDGTDLDFVTGNPELARQRWQEGFSEPLEIALAQSTTAADAETSPIMGAIQEIVVERMGTEAERALPTRLYVASDFLENTELFSMYVSGADFTAWESSSSAVKYATNLAGAEVQLWSIKRSTAISSAEVAEFWAAWVLENRGKFVNAIALQGL